MNIHISAHPDTALRKDIEALERELVGSSRSLPCGDGERAAAPSRPAVWSLDAAYAEAFAAIDRELGPATGKWRPLSEDARGFGPARLEEDR
jgi:hypothetical protein